MFQIEECQVKIQYRSHLIEFQHHIEGVQRFFINQVLSIPLSLYLSIEILSIGFRSLILNLQLLVLLRKSSVGQWSAVQLLLPLVD